MKLPLARQARLDLDTGDAGAVWLPPPQGAQLSRNIHHHRHPELEINLVVRGDCTYLIGSRTYLLAVNCLTWLFPGQDHCLVQRSPDFAMIIAVWTPACVAQVAAGLGVAELAQADPGVRCHRLPISQSRADTELLTALASAGRVERNLGLPYALARLWQHSATAAVATSADLPAALTRAIRLLGDSERCRTVSVASLARGADLSADHFARLFRRHLGCTPVEFRNRSCLDRFLDQWRPGVPAMDLAYACGFGSYTAFNRSFRATLGISPRAWIAARNGLMTQA
jgi:AraC-like DNA-binding protein